MKYYEVPECCMQILQLESADELLIIDFCFGNNGL